MNLTPKSLLIFLYTRPGLLLVLFSRDKRIFNRQRASTATRRRQRRVTTVRRCWRKWNRGDCRCGSSRSTRDPGWSSWGGFGYCWRRRGGVNGNEENDGERGGGGGGEGEGGAKRKRSSYDDNVVIFADFRIVASIASPPTPAPTPTSRPARTSTPWTGPTRTTSMTRMTKTPIVLYTTRTVRIQNSNRVRIKNSNMVVAYKAYVGVPTGAEVGRMRRTPDRRSIERPAR